MSWLKKVDRIELPKDRDDIVYFVASSFEPRSVRATSLIVDDRVSRAVVFNYEDTLDTAMGRDNVARVKDHLKTKGVRAINILPCKFSDPYSVVRVLDSLVSKEALVGSIGSALIDATCFTKLHLLLLLRYLDDDLSVESIQVCYTEPLSYATSFGRELSYGIEKTVYLPYYPEAHKSQRVGLIAFLGHERLRLERIIQDLEPEVSVVIFGRPGFTQDMQDYSWRVNESLIYRTEYDAQYEIAEAPANDFIVVSDILREQIRVIQDRGCDTVYLAPLGTKLQALGIDMLRRSGFPMRTLLAYTIPKRYERSMYSQGSGFTYVGSFT